MSFLLPTYAVYLIGFSMLAMFIAIICLSLALYMALKNKPIFGFINTQKEYIRQDSSNVPTLRTQYLDEENINDGSTFTVNSGIIEVTRESEPPTPVPEVSEETKIVFAKKPLAKAMVPIDRGQMEEICRAVLQKKEKRSDSASYRDLSALLNDNKHEKKSDLDEESEIIKKLRELKAANKDASKTGNNKELQKEDKIEINIEEEKEESQETTQEKEETITQVKQNTLNGPLNNLTTQLINELKLSPKLSNKSEVTIEIEDDSKTKVKKTLDLKVKSTDEDAEDMPALYDTVPTPVKCMNGDETDVDSIPVYDFPPNSDRRSGAQNDDDGEDIPVYDLLPRNQDKKSNAEDEDNAEDIPVYDLPPKNNDGKCIKIVDQEGDYLFPISTEKTDSCYVNAKISH